MPQLTMCHLPTKSAGESWVSAVLYLQTLEGLESQTHNKEVLGQSKVSKLILWIVVLHHNF